MFLLHIFLYSRPSMLSESEMEDDPNSHVEVPQKLPYRGNIVSQQSSIRLSELGPRLTLQVSFFFCRFHFIH